MHVVQDDDQSNQRPGYFLQQLNYNPFKFEAAAVGSSFGWACLTQRGVGPVVILDAGVVQR
ncbi:hypothetical protein N7493_006908 [Penicillium malachiteum]|uniref:Uncharacterized protein n=1 Tax=Penicillium malachiteum TaxID=1324776 RepID=A0AAD6HJJ8_9EURO|nr:hypothetical protein N7493_006908 [Penicillium malachiteum]